MKYGLHRVKIGAQFGEFWPVYTDGNLHSIQETDTDPENPFLSSKCPHVKYPLFRVPRPVVTSACSSASYSWYLFVWINRMSWYSPTYPFLSIDNFKISKANTPNRLRSPSPILLDMGPKLNRPMFLKQCPNGKLVPGDFMAEHELLRAEATRPHSALIISHWFPSASHGMVQCKPKC